MHEKTAVGEKNERIGLSPEKIYPHAQTQHLLVRLAGMFKMFNFDLSHNTDVILKFIYNLKPAQFVVYDRVDLDSQEFATCRGYGLPEGFRLRGRLAGRVGYDQWIGKGVSTIILNAVQQTEYRKTDPDIKTHGLCAYIGSAVIVNGQVAGMLSVFSKKADSFDPTDGLIIGLMSGIISFMENRNRIESNPAKKRANQAVRLDESETLLCRMLQLYPTDIYPLDLANVKVEIEKHAQYANELRLKTDQLAEMNTAMRVLLDKREEDCLRAEENTRLKLCQLIKPYLDKLSNSGVDRKQRQILDVINAILEEFIFAPVYDFNSRYTVLSPNELKVAKLIHKGKTSKEIAVMLTVSERTVESYRHSIRKKLGLKNKKISLNSFLSSW